MPNLGNKFECFSCGAKFYDLGKSDAICPKCGANQKDAKHGEPTTDMLAARRRRKEDLVRKVEVDDTDAAAHDDEVVDVDDEADEAIEAADAHEEEEEDELEEV